MKFGTDILGSQRRNRSIHTPFIHPPIHPIIFLCLSNSGGGRLCCTRVGSLNHVAWDHYQKRKTASGKLKCWKTACEVSIFIKWNLIYCLDSYLKHNEFFFLFHESYNFGQQLHRGAFFLDYLSSFTLCFETSRFFTNTFSALSILWLFSAVTTRWSHIHNFSYCLVGAQRSRFTGKNRTSVEWRENVLKPLLWENKQEKKTKIGQFQPKVKHFYPLLHLNSYFEVRRNTVRCIKWWENKWKAKLTVSYWVFGDTQLHF